MLFRDLAWGLGLVYWYGAMHWAWRVLAGEPSWSRCPSSWVSVCWGGMAAREEWKVKAAVCNILDAGCYITDKKKRK